MGTSEGIPDTYITDANLARVVHEAREPHDGFLRYAEQNEVYLKPADIDAIRERATEAEEAAVAAHAGAVATAKAATRDPGQLPRRELGEVPQFNVVATRMVVTRGDQTTVITNFQGGRLEGQPNVRDAQWALRMAAQRDDKAGAPGRTRQAITFAPMHGERVRAEYACTTDDGVIGLEMVMDERVSETIEQAVVGNPSMVYDYMDRLSTGWGTRVSPVDQLAYTVARPEFAEWGPDSVLFYQSTTGGEQIQRELLPNAPVA